MSLVMLIAVLSIVMVGLIMRSVVVVVDGLHLLPLSVAEELGSGRGHKAAGMASHHHQLVAKGKGKMSGTRGVQTGQVVNLKRNGQQMQR